MDLHLRTWLASPDPGPEAERRLALLARGGDRRARDALINGAMRLVVQRALMLGFRGADLDDAVQAGAVGLIRAVDRFDPEAGARLATFAWWWVGDAMRDAVPPDARPMAEVPERASASLPACLLAPEEVPEVLRLRYRIGEEPGPPRSRAEVARRLGMTPAQVRTAEARAVRLLRARLGRIVHRAPRRGADPP